MATKSTSKKTAGKKRTSATKAGGAKKSGRKASGKARAGSESETQTGRATAEATLRHVRISPQKARLAVDLIKGKQVEPALRILRFTPKKSAQILSKLLQSAIANAREQKGADVDRLWVTGGWVNEGRTLKRYMPRARGMATQILKRSSHITIQVGER